MRLPLPKISKNRLPGVLADGALFLLIASAPILGGSSNPIVLPWLVLLAMVAFGATLTSNYRRGRSLSLHGPALLIAVLLVFTIFQVVPLPPSVLGLISSKALEIRNFIGQERGFHPISYEVVATHREIAKLAIYLLVALVAYERVRVRHGLELVAIPVVVGGLGAATLALIHRVLGVDELLGVLPSMSPLSSAVTTFANPNHAAGYMTLAALVSLGLGMGDAAKHRRFGALTAAFVCAGVSMLALSRGGLMALVLGLVLLGILSFRFRKSDDRVFQLAASAVFFVAFAVATLGAFWRGDEIAREFGASDAGFALSVKLDGIRDALPMVLDHLITGVGRGSFVSAYPIYKTSPIQLVFVFPENLVVQLLSEWGAIFGSLTLLALVVGAVLRVAKARRPLVLASMVGVVAVVFHNMLDFSLELPGVAIAVIALFSGAGVEATKRVRLPTRERILFPLFVFALLSSVAVYGTYVALSGGSLDEDLALLRSRAETMIEGKKPGGGAVSNEAIAWRHPTNGYVAAQVSYLFELENPPDLQRALAYTNRALFLAPTYADAHLAAGRILIRAGHRSQGFSAIRRAWDLAGADRKDAVIDHILDLAHSPEEFALAIPRRIPELDVVREGELARGVRVALSKKKSAWVRAVLDGAVEDPDSVPVGGLYQLALAAHAAGHTEMTANLIRIVLERDPRHPKATLLQSRLWMREHRRDEAKVLVEQMLARSDITEERPEFLKIRINIALAENDLDDARIYLDQLAATAIPTRRGQASLLRYRATVERKAGDDKKALEALDRAIEIEPEDTGYRMARAELLFDLGELQRAKNDVDFVLKRRPRLGSARRLWKQIESAPKEKPKLPAEAPPTENAEPPENPP